MPLQLVLGETPQDRAPDRAQQAVPDLVAAETAGEPAGDGAAEAAVGLLGVLGLGLVVGSGDVLAVLRNWGEERRGEERGEGGLAYCCCCCW